MAQRKLSDWINGFAEYASIGEAPHKLYFWTAISTLAGAVRRNCYINMSTFKWIPNFYIVFVAPPGVVQKSTTINIGLNLLRQIEGIHFGPDIVTWQALMQRFAESTEVEITEDGEAIYSSAMTLGIDEFGTFYNGENKELTDVLVSLWDGKDGKLEKLTKGSGNDVISNPFINLIACTTPAWLSSNLPAYTLGGGFISRTLFIYADKKAKFIAYPALYQNPERDQLKAYLLEDLKRISQLKGEFRFTPEAIEWGTDWYQKHWSQPHNLTSEQFAAYNSRKQTMMHKLAMLRVVAKRDDLYIDVEDLSGAADILDATELEFSHVFSKIGLTPQTRGVDLILSGLKQSPVCGYQQLFSTMFRFLSQKEYEDSISALVLAGKISVENPDGRRVIRLLDVESQSPEQEVYTSPLVPVQ